LAVLFVASALGLRGSSSRINLACHFDAVTRYAVASKINSLRDPQDEMNRTQTQAIQFHKKVFPHNTDV